MRSAHKNKKLGMPRRKQTQKLGMRKHNTVTTQPSIAQTLKDKSEAALKRPISVGEGLMQRLQ